MEFLKRFTSVIQLGGNATIGKGTRTNAWGWSKWLKGYCYERIGARRASFCYEKVIEARTSWVIMPRIINPM